MLAEYVKTGSEAAFQELLKCYLDLVYSAAIRIVSNAHLAEDVAQTVFVDLARLARTLPAGVMLGGWLHRHTCFVALTMIRGERRRQAREQKAAEMNALEQQPDSGLAQVAPILDKAIDQLTAEDRTAILLRFFEQLDFRSVGEALGSSEEAAKKRVSRAVEKLHHLLTARGVTLSATALAAGLAAEAVKAAPARLAASISGAVAAGVAVGAAGHGAALTLFKFMTASKIAVAIAGVAVVAGGAFFARQHQAQAALRQENEALRQRVEGLTATAKESSDRLAQASRREPGANDQLRELMRLRGELGVLKRQLAEAGKARGQVAPAGQSQAVADPQEQMLRTMRARIGDAHTWGLAFLQYADDHQGQVPAGLDQLAKYLDSAYGGTTPHNYPGDPPRDDDKGEFIRSSNQFEIVYQGLLKDVTNPVGTIVLRGTETWPSPNGGTVRVYGFADGHSETHRAPDGDFGPWEAEHIQTPAGQ